MELENAVNAGISWRLLSVGLVSPFEEHLARLERNLTMREWYGMSETERAMIVAVRRVEKASEGHQTDAEIRKMKAESKKGRR